MDSDALNYPGNLGNFWSSTVSSSSVAYYLSFYSTRINPADSYSRYIGRTVRCVALNTPIPKIKVLSIAHYSSSAEATSSVALCTPQVTMASIGLALCSPIPTPGTCLSVVVVPIRRISTVGTADFLSAA